MWGKFAGADLRVCISFLLFGITNNILYIITLAAALDLVGPSVPKSIVLISNVVPSFTAKLVGVQIIYAIPYFIRIIILAMLSMLGILLVVIARDEGDLAMKMAGVAVASIASGVGEVSYLGLTHYYGHSSLAFWGSGTGGAGILGSSLYAAATTGLGWTVQKTLLVSALTPIVMLLSFFILLPRDPLKSATGFRISQYETLPHEEDSDSDNDNDNNEERHSEGYRQNSDNEASRCAGNETGLKGSPSQSKVVESLVLPKRESFMQRIKQAQTVFKLNLRRAQVILFPYTLPLLLVYIAEYTINLGVSPTLLFPLESSPFHKFRDFYPTYIAIYQSGAFVSRSSSSFFRTHRLYLLCFLQFINLFFLIAQALWAFISNVYFIFAIIFWEGLLGGLVFVNAYHQIMDNVHIEDREFSLGVTSVSESGGVCIAGFLCIAIETLLCGYQVKHGRAFCKQR